jgi:zinc protease
MMSGKIVSATPFINEVQEGLSGNSSKKDLETMFQLIYLRFTQPRADKNAFDVQLNQLRHCSPIRARSRNTIFRKR